MRGRLGSPELKIDEPVSDLLAASSLLVISGVGGAAPDTGERSADRRSADADALELTELSPGDEARSQPCG